MNPANLLRWVVLSAFLWAAAGSSRADSKLVMAYYMPWFVAKPYSERWGWHWTMDHFNPDKVNSLGEREIASWYYPLIGPYDSSDPAVLEYHMLLMKLSGIDGVVVDWYGAANFLDYGDNNRATIKVLEFARKAGLKFAVCYEDQTIAHLIESKGLVAQDASAHAREEMSYLQKNFFSDASYLRWKDRPVLLNFGPQYFKANSDWDEIFSVLAKTNQPAFFTEDNRVSGGLGAFNWPPMWISQAPGTGGVLSGAALEKYIADFEVKAGTWPAFISSAFPRFHDIYERAGVRNYWGYLGDRKGKTFRDTLGQAMTNSSFMVQIVTWNDFGEGSMVEPTKEYGFRDLGIMQDFRRQFLEKDFSRDTNDLALAFRFYNLRRKYAGDATVTAKLDNVFSNVVSGDLQSAKIEMSRLKE